MKPASGGSRAGARLPLVLLSLCGLFYVAYVTGGLVFGVSALYLRAQAAGLRPVTLPLFPQGLSLPRISLPSIVSPLTLVPDWTGTERVNVLVLGVDQRQDEKAVGLPTRSDTMMVASIDPVQKTAAVISFPRDLWVTIPGFGEERINVAYRNGELRRVEGGGAAVAAQTIERNFGIRTPYFVAVDFQGFQEIIDTLGGVVVDVPRPLKDDAYPTDDYNTERVYFLPGPQLMNGSTALKYSRTRHSDSDFARMGRQQQIMMSLRDRALRLNMLSQFPSLIDQGMRTIRTNLSPTEILSLAKLFGQIDRDALSTLVVDRELVTSFTGYDGASLLAPNRPAIQRAIQQLFLDPRIAAEEARVEVSAPAAASTLARQVVDRLTAAGLKNVRQVAVTGAQPESTEVFTSGQKPKSVEFILRTLVLPQSVLSQAAAQDGASDIRIVPGRDFEKLTTPS
ncbi:MAG: LCP family protein [Chloroflexi bacterium]|nr:LCP family protein [Chloroflexota bacterium]